MIKRKRQMFAESQKGGDYDINFLPKKKNDISILCYTTSNILVAATILIAITN